MGLDMFMSARRHLSTYNTNETVQTARTALAEVMQQLGAPVDSAVNDVTVEVAYWRKANAVHQFFVNNCQNGEDDCRTSYVGRDKLEELKVLCEQIVLTPALAGEQLPTTEGFFFGSQEYGEHYIEDLKTTIEIVERCLQMPDDWEFYYHSSW